MARAPRVPSSAGWKISLTIPLSCASFCLSTCASPSPIVVWPSCAQACIIPGLQEANPSRNGRWLSSHASLRSRASMSTRNARVGPGRPVSRVATIPVNPPSNGASHFSGAPCARARANSRARVASSGNPIRLSASTTSRPIASA